MKKSLIILLSLVCIFGCGKQDKDKAVIAKVNNYEVTRGEFEEAFRGSNLSGIDSVESRKEFLNNLISQKLILQDAQRKALDKDKSFLKMIEKFWEQSLLKLALDRKSKEIAGSVSVSDKEIETAYNKMSKEGKAGKPYGEMYKQIKWELVQAKQTQAMNDWIAALNKEADIEVNCDLLSKEAQ